MNEFFKKLAFTYCLFLIRPIDGNFSYQALEEHFDSIIEFLLFTGNSSFLFTTIMDFMFQCDYSTLFMTHIEAYIQSAKIKYIPDSAL